LNCVYDREAAQGGEGLTANFPFPSKNESAITAYAQLSSCFHCISASTSNCILQSLSAVASIFLKQLKPQNIESLEHFVDDRLTQSIIVFELLMLLYPSRERPSLATLDDKVL